MAAELLENFDFGDQVHTPTFEQILDMDDEDDGDYEFSKSIVFGFFDQAENTFVKMDDALKKKDLEELSQLGHFLKGSSATLGYTKIKWACEKIQHFGHGKDADGLEDMKDKEKALRLIGECISDAKTSFKIVERLMRDFYEQLGAP